MPTLTQLHYIVELHRAGHFGRAAVACHISQPTLSAQIAKAEDELGVCLFDRRARPVEATRHGHAIIVRAHEVLAAHARLMAMAAGTERLSGPFTLGVIPTLAPYVLPWFLGPFAERHPALELKVLERPTEVIVRDLQAMHMDAGIVATPLGERGLENRVLFYDPFYLYAHADSPLLERDEVQVADIADKELWLLEDGHCFRSQVVHLCGLQTRTLLSNLRFEAGSFETLRGVIDQAGGCTLVPESYARTLPQEVRRARVRPFPEPVPTREVGLVAQRAHWKTDILEAMASALREQAPRCLPRSRGDSEVLPIVS